MDYDEYIKYYGKTLDIIPINIEILHDKGESLFKLGDYNASIYYCNKALDIDPNERFALDKKELVEEKPTNQRQCLKWDCRLILY